MTSSNVLVRNVVLPIILVVLVVLLGPIFIAILSIFVLLMIPMVIGALIYFFVLGGPKDKNDPEDVVQNAFNHPQLGPYIQQQNLRQDLSEEIAFHLGNQIKVRPDEATLKTSVFNLSLSGITSGGSPLLIQFFPGIFSIFSDLTELRLDRIGINNDPNHQLFLQPSVFDGLTQLRVLDMSNNQISDLPEGLFSHLHSLERVLLVNNPIDLQLAAISTLREKGIIIEIKDDDL